MQLVPKNDQTPINQRNMEISPLRIIMKILSQIRSAMGDLGIPRHHLFFQVRPQRRAIITLNAPENSSQNRAVNQHDRTKSRCII